MSEPAAKGGFGVFIKGKAKPVAPGLSSVVKPKDVKKRWLYVGAGVAVVLMTVSSLMQDKPVEREVPKKKEEATIDVTPADGDKRALAAKLGEDVQRMDRDLREMKSELNKRDEQIRSLQEKVEKGGSGTKGGDTNLNSLGTSAGTVPRPPAPPVDRTTPTTVGVPVLPPIQAGNTIGIAPAAGSNGMAVPPILPAQEQRKPLVYDAPPSSSNSDKPDVEAKIQYRKNENAGALGLGFVPVSLLNGLDAGTSQTTQSNPMPVLMNVTDNMVLPGLDRYRMKNCFLLGSGYGDLSSERVYVRVSKISCVDKNNKLALTSDVTGVVNDADGKLGLRGKIVDRQGARLGKAVLAGFAQGLTQALAAGQASTTTSALTGATTSALQGSAVARAAGLTGAQNAANQLAEFYLKEAQNIFPVISVDTGRLGTVMFTSAAKLVWQSTDTKYIQEVTPTGAR